MGMADLTWDTTTVVDGVYRLLIYGFDAAGDPAKTMIPVIVDNLSDVCPGDPVLADTDGDFIKNPCDNCVNDSNTGQQDFDFDSLGGVCDPDDDEDGFPDGSDCNPLNETVPAAPTEARHLAVAGDADGT